MRNKKYVCGVSFVITGYLSDNCLCHLKQTKSLSDNRFATLQYPTRNVQLVMDITVDFVKFKGCKDDEEYNLVFIKIGFKICI